MATLQKTGKTLGMNLVEPVRTNSEGIAKYLAKYLAKSIIIREVNHQEAQSEFLRGKGLVSKSTVDEEVRKPPSGRLYGCGGGKTRRTVWSGFAWHSPGSQAWRKEVQAFAAAIGISDYDQLSEKLGKHWCWNNMELIANWTGSPDDLEQAGAIGLRLALEHWTKK